MTALRFRRPLVIVIALTLLLIVGGGMLIVSSATLQDRLVSIGVDARVSRKPPSIAGRDAMQVLLCGTSPPPPSRVRAKSCTIVSANGMVFVVDAGPGSVNNLSEWRFPMQRVGAVLLTHFHSDHIGDLGELRMQSWVMGRKRPLPLYGPAGVASIADGFNTAYAADADYRGPEHGLNIDAARFTARDFGLADAASRASHMADRVIFEANGMRVTAFEVDHEPVWPAVGYRFDYRGRSVVISGDTRVSPNLVAHARGVDLLVHEAQSPDDLRLLSGALRRNGEPHLADVVSVVRNYHATPVEVAAEANAAQVRKLVFNHMGPIAPDNVLTSWVFTRGVSQVRASSGWSLGYDGLQLTLPVGSTRVEGRNVR